MSLLIANNEASRTIISGKEVPTMLTGLKMSDLPIPGSSVSAWGQWIKDQGVATAILLFLGYTVIRAFPGWIEQQRQDDRQARTEFTLAIKDARGEYAANLMSVTLAFQASLKVVHDEKRREQELMTRLLKSSNVSAEQFRAAVDAANNEVTERIRTDADKVTDKESGTGK